MLNNYIDELKYTISGDNYRINEYITIYNPYVYEVKDFGEDIYNHVVNLFTRKPYDIAVELFDKGIDYQSITDWDLFYETITATPIEFTCILFGKLDFTKFVQCINTENNMKCLIHKENHNIIIDEVIYRKIVTYLRYMHYISEKIEYDMGNASGKRFLIDRMRRKQKKLLKDYETGKIKKHSNIGNMIKYCVNNANFKYDYSSVMRIRLNLLYESYYFITTSDEREHIMNGIYHGTIDVSKMKDKNILNVIPDLHK